MSSSHKSDVRPASPEERAARPTIACTANERTSGEPTPGVPVTRTGGRRRRRWPRRRSTPRGAAAPVRGAAPPSRGGDRRATAKSRQSLSFDRFGDKRRRVGDLGGQAQMAQDPLNHRGLIDQRDQAQPPGTPGTRQHVKPEASAHQVGRRRGSSVDSTGHGPGGARSGGRRRAPREWLGPAERPFVRAILSAVRPFSSFVLMSVGVASSSMLTVAASPACGAWWMVWAACRAAVGGPCAMSETKPATSARATASRVVRLSTCYLQEGQVYESGEMRGS
jgi:hypothetical protein